MNNDIKMAGPVTRSSVKTDDDWVINLDAANCNVTDTRRLSHCILKHVMTLPAKAPILMLVRVADQHGC